MNNRPNWRLEKLYLWQWIMLVASEKKIFTYVSLALLYLDAIVLTLMGFFGERANEIHVQNLVRRVCPLSEFSSMPECAELRSVVKVFKKIGRTISGFVVKFMKPKSDILFILSQDCLLASQLAR
jgi:hypothetical protein